MINDIRFFNLLEESHIDFRCIDFPWFYKENLPLIKAVVLYEILEIRINVEDIKLTDWPSMLQH